MLSNKNIVKMVLSEPNIKYALLEHTNLTKNQVEFLMSDSKFDFENSSKQELDQVVYYYHERNLTGGYNG